MIKKILIADDDREILNSIKMMLEFEGYEVNTTINGAAVKKLCMQSPHLLLLDVWMSGQNGKEICQALKSSPKTKHTPVILVSANKDIAKIAKESGADGFLAKPFDMKDLLSIVATYANKKMSEPDQGRGAP